METLDHNPPSGNQVSERAMRNFQQSSVWVIIVSSVGLFLGLFFMYVAMQNMGRGRYGSQQGGIQMIVSMVILAQHIIGLTYGIGLSKLKISTTEEFDNASSKHITYWVFCGIISIITFLLLLMALSSGAGRFM